MKTAVIGFRSVSRRIALKAWYNLAGPCIELIFLVTYLGPGLDTWTLHHHRPGQVTYPYAKSGDPVKEWCKWGLGRVGFLGLVTLFAAGWGEEAGRSVLFG